MSELEENASESANESIDEKDISYKRDVEEDSAEESNIEDSTEESEEDIDEMKSEVDAEDYDPDLIRTGTKFHRRIIVIKDENRITSDTITKTEITELISIRATQISQNNIVFTKVIPGETNPINMAKQEFNDRKTPLLLTREFERLENGELVKYVEKWDPNLMNHAISFNIAQNKK